MTVRVLVAMALGAVIGAACGDRGGADDAASVVAHLPACGSARPFTVLPLPASAITGWVPLGNLNPPAHTFPTDHQYLYLAPGSSPLPLVAPGNIWITQAKTTQYNRGAVSLDYAVSFGPCHDVLGAFGHVRTLTPELLAALGPFDQSCSTYSPDPSLTVTQCYSRVVSVPVAAGTVIGTSAGLDFSLFDRRVTAGTFANPARWSTASSGFDRFHTVAASDYFAEPAASQVSALLGMFDGRTRRTVPPLGGTIFTDVAGTLQGVWLRPSLPTFPESPHLAIAPDNVDPTSIDISVGTSQTGVASGTYRIVPQTTGTVDRDPTRVTPGTTVYCYDLRLYFGNGQQGALLVQLTDATTMRAEWRAGTCGTLADQTLSAAAVTYVR